MIIIPKSLKEINNKYIIHHNFCPKFHLKKPSTLWLLSPLILSQIKCWLHSKQVCFHLLILLLKYLSNHAEKIQNTRSNKNVKFFWRKPFSVETPSLGEKSFLGRSHFWGEALFGEKPFSGRSHFLGRSHSGEKPFSVKKPFSGRSHFSSVFWHYFEKNSNFCSLSPPAYCLIWKDLFLRGEYNRICFIYVSMLKLCPKYARSPVISLEICISCGTV